MPSWSTSITTLIPLKSIAVSGLYPHPCGRVSIRALHVTPGCCISLKPVHTMPWIVGGKRSFLILSTVTKPIAFCPILPPVYYACSLAWLPIHVILSRIIDFFCPVCFYIHNLARRHRPEKVSQISFNNAWSMAVTHLSRLHRVFEAVILATRRVGWFLLPVSYYQWCIRLCHFHWYSSYSEAAK